MSRQQKIIDSVSKERDVAIATLNTHNLYQKYVGSLTEVKGGVTENHLSSEVLSQQNIQLRAAVSSMRRELEQLSRGKGRGYLAHLEQELVRVRTENRRLRAEGRPPRASPRQLGEALADLQREKREVEQLKASLREREEEVRVCCGEVCV